MFRMINLLYVHSDTDFPFFFFCVCLERNQKCNYFLFSPEKQLPLLEWGWGKNSSSNIRKLKGGSKLINVDTYIQILDVQVKGPEKFERCILID